MELQKTVGLGLVVLTLLVASTAAQDCALPSTTYLAATSETVVHGVFDPSIPPVAHVRSGDTLVGECVSTNSNSDYAKMVRGDPGVEDIFYWPNGVSRLNKSTPQYPNSGGHFLTGPIRVCGAEEGDVLKVEILDMKPRINPSTGRTFGANFQGRSYTQSYIGTRYGDYNFTATNATTIMYEVISDAYGEWAQPVYQFTTPQFLSPDGRSSGVAMVPHTQNIGVAPGNFTPSVNQDPRTFPAFEEVSYPDGFQSVLNQSTPIEYINTAKLNWRVPLRQHFGVVAVTPKDAKNYERTATQGAGAFGAGSGPPSNFGGNIDNWRMGKGMTVYLKVQVPDALFTFGDCHAAEGDAESSSSAIESSNTGTFRFELIKQADLPKGLASLKGPLYEFADSFSLQGFSYMDYLNELPVPSAVANKSLGEDLNKPMANCYKATRDFLMDSFDLEEREAIGLMSVGVDFGVTEVVDGNWGVHSIIKKSFFSRRFTAQQGPMAVGGAITSARKLRTFQDLPDKADVFQPDLLDLLNLYKEESDVSFNWSK